MMSFSVHKSSPMYQPTFLSHNLKTKDCKHSDDGAFSQEDVASVLMLTCSKSGNMVPDLNTGTLLWRETLQHEIQSNSQTNIS